MRCDSPCDSLERLKIERLMTFNYIRNGLKYHKAYGSCVKKTLPSERSSDRPYFCYEDDCAKAYKNMNGLR